MFDRYVQGTKPSWKRRAVLLVALGLHAIAGVVLVVYSFIHVEEITPPALSLTFFSAAPPPPPPPPPAKHHEVKHIEKKIVTPTTVPQLVQPKQEEEKPDEDDGEEGGVEGGVAGGVKGGVVGGVVGGTGTPGPAKPKNVPQHVFDTEKLSGENPHLPDIVKIQRKGTGDAIWMGKVCVDQSGHVNQVTTIQGIPGGDVAIVEGLRTWRFKNQPVPICTMLRFVYTID